MDQVRPAAVAGQFYPADPGQLRQLVTSFLPPASDEPPPKILIVPHAGYQYSGPTAGQGFGRWQNAPWQQIFLLGPSHHLAFTGAALDSHAAWQTPLGQVPVAQPINQALAALPNVAVNPAAHQNEHCLEVQLPFLQVVLDHFAIVPILFGTTNPDFRRQLAQSLANYLRQANAALVVSSDLSHYPPADLAPTIDKTTIAAIIANQPAAFLATVQDQEARYGIATAACGAAAIATALEITAAWPGHWHLLDYRHSGQQSPFQDEVVGYAALGFWPDEKT